MTKNNQKTQPSEVLDSFLHNIDSINASVPLMMIMLAEMLKKQNEKLRTFLQNHGTLQKTDDETETYALPTKDIFEERKITRKLDQYITAATLIPRNFLVAFVSEYDAFLGSLIKCFYTKKPELMSGLEKQIAFSDLLNFSSLEEVKDYILEKDVEGVLRRSHSDHFDALEKKFNIKLRKDLKCWPMFIEIMERRNLFVHCDGQVSSQYISVCTEHGTEFSEKPAIGTKLHVSPEYIADAHKTLREIAIKLTHVLWRKVFPEERELADNALLNLGYELIQRGSFPLAINIMEFAISLPHHFNDTQKRMFYVNLAQAYKHNGDPKKCQEVVNRLDWSSVTYKFQLAVAVLRDDFSSAALLMEKAAKTDELTEENFLQWPLFKNFREKEEFAEAFKKIYKRPPPEKGSATIPLDKSNDKSLANKAPRRRTKPLSASTSITERKGAPRKSSKQ